MEPSWSPGDERGKRHQPPPSLSVSEIKRRGRNLWRRAVNIIKWRYAECGSSKARHERERTATGPRRTMRGSERASVGAPSLWTGDGPPRTWITFERDNSRHRSRCQVLGASSCHLPSLLLRSSILFQRLCHYANDRIPSYLEKWSLTLYNLNTDEVHHYQILSNKN